MKLCHAPASLYFFRQNLLSKLFEKIVISEILSCRYFNLFYFTSLNQIGQSWINGCPIRFIFGGWQAARLQGLSVQLPRLSDFSLQNRDFRGLLYRLRITSHSSSPVSAPTPAAFASSSGVADLRFSIVLNCIIIFAAFFSPIPRTFVSSDL